MSKESIHQIAVLLETPFPIGLQISMKVVIIQINWIPDNNLGVASDWNLVMFDSKHFLFYFSVFSCLLTNCFAATIPHNSNKIEKQCAKYGKILTRQCLFTTVIDCHLKRIVLFRQLETANKQTRISRPFNTQFYSLCYIWSVVKLFRSCVLACE